MPLVNTVKYLRLRNKWTRAFVSVEANICLRTIDYYESGAVSIPFDIAKNLAKLFDYDVDEIVGKNRKVFIDDDEYEQNFPQVPSAEILKLRMDQFINGTLPKRSLTDVYKEITKRKDGLKD